MAETLSQKDIDAILHAGGRVTAGAPPLEIRPYDFVRPPRVSRDRRAALEAIRAMSKSEDGTAPSPLEVKPLQGYFRS